MQYKYIIKKLSIYLLFTYLISYCINLTAWNFQGHQLISEIAYKELSKEEQQKLDTILDQLIVKLPPKYKKTFKKQPYSLSKIAKLSIMPDLWKHYNLNDLFDSLNITDKKILKDIDNQKTNDWHYKSFLIKENKSIQKSNNYSYEGKLDFIINKLLSNVKNTEDKISKAFAIIFITHLLEDAHQPLHTISKELTNNKNHYDKGGNLFCLRRKNNICTYNLHQYWDNAGGLLNNNIKSLAKNIITAYPKNNLQEINETNPSIWLEESFQYNAMVYTTIPNTMPDKVYQAQVRAITSQRIALAAYRLQNILKNLLQ